MNVEPTEESLSIAFADNLGHLVEAADTPQLDCRVNECLDRIAGWMKTHELELTQKTEVALFKGPRDGKKRQDVAFEIMGSPVIPKRQIKYLGVIIDDNLSFGKHVKYITGNPVTKMAALLRIMPNKGGHYSSKRVVLYGLVQSVILHASPVWSEVIKTKSYAAMLESVQRRALLRVASRYRIVLTRAIILVVTGIPTVSIIIEKRNWLYVSKEGHLAQKQKKKETGYTFLKKDISHKNKKVLEN